MGIRLWLVGSKEPSIVMDFNILFIGSYSTLNRIPSCPYQKVYSYSSYHKFWDKLSSDHYLLCFNEVYRQTCSTSKTDPY